MFCKQCGAQLASGVRFCMTCGQAVEAAAQSFAQPQPESTVYNFNAFEEPEKPRKKPPIKWIAIGAAAIVAVLLTVMSISAAEDAKYLKPGNSPALADSLSPIKVDAAAAANCDALTAAIPSDATVQTLNSRAAAMSKVANGTARKASSYVHSAAWIYSTEIVSIEPAMDRALSDSLAELITKSPVIKEENRAEFSVLWAKEYRDLVIDKCGLTDKLAAALMAQQAFTTAKSNLETLAASVPWYPDGFNEWSSDSNVAWKWVNGINCNLGDWCWHIKVVTQTGCPGGVYAELNILDSGDNVIDYSNDTIPSLGAGSTAILEFSTYNSRSEAGQMTTITCHKY